MHRSRNGNGRANQRRRSEFLEEACRLAGSRGLKIILFIWFYFSQKRIKHFKKMRFSPKLIVSHFLSNNSDLSRVCRFPYQEKSCFWQVYFHFFDFFFFNFFQDLYFPTFLQIIWIWQIDAALPDSSVSRASRMSDSGSPLRGREERASIRQNLTEKGSVVRGRGVWKTRIRSISTLFSWSLL